MEQVLSFLSLFLGLVVGSHDVGVQAREDVVRVELRLDGEVLGALPRGEEPGVWTGVVDFGQEVLPHRLVAVGYGVDGGELGRAEQWLNLPRPAAEVSLLLDLEARPPTARIAWESLTGDPVSWQLFFDGEPLEASDLSAVELPDFDDQQLHFLRAEVDFPENVSAVAEATFGGFYADQVQSELTSIAVELDGRRRLPSIEELQGWLLYDGEPVRVVASEKGGADIVLVRSRRAHGAAVAHYRRVAAGRPTGQSRPRWLAPVDQDQRLQFLWPYTERRVSGGRVYELFAPSPIWDGSTGGWLWFLAQFQQPAYAASRQLLVDAVSVAAVNAARSNRRRAVVLLVTPDSDDASALRLDQVRGYLAALSVPFEVWLYGNPDDTDRWSGAVSVESWMAFTRAVRRLQKRLARQRILWIEGRLLPQKLELSPLAEGLVLVR